MFKLILMLLSLSLLSSWCISDDAEKLTDLKKQRYDLFQKMHEKRAELIEKDADLKNLHEKVMALHREMSLMLDKNKDMAPLVRQAKELENEIKTLEQSIAEKGGKAEKKETD